MDQLCTARDREAAMLSRCASVALGVVPSTTPSNAREANVFRVAAMVIQTRFPKESKCLMEAAEYHFGLNPEDLAPAASVIQNGDVISLPRLRDGLTRILRQKASSK